MTRNAILFSAMLVLASVSASRGAMALPASSPNDVLTGTLSKGSSAGRTRFFDNFPFNQYYGYFVCGSSACGGQTDSPALQFISGATGTTTKVSVPISSYSSDYTSDVRVVVRADNNGVPGTVLAKKSVTAPPCCVTTTVRMTVNLTSGGAYWLEVAPRTSNDFALWQLSDSTDTCAVAENYSGTGWSTSSTTTCPAGRIVGNGGE